MRLFYDKSHRRLHKFAFYTRHSLLGVLPYRFLRKDLARALAYLQTLPVADQYKLQNRVDYYNQLEKNSQLMTTRASTDYFPWQKPSSYYYDLANLVRYFPPRQRFAYQFGDIIQVPNQPTFVKSRPIYGDNEHAVLLKLNSLRHFYIYPDSTPFREKKAQLVWRGAAHQAQRIAFLHQFFDNPLCNVGSVNKESIAAPYHRDYLSVAEQLRYRYILSIEGNDVATNLKWILASNSLCFMTAPKYETWLMEGRLQPNVHYVQVKGDYSDLEEKIAFYDANPAAAEQIIANANTYMRPFQDEKQELLVGLMVMQKYFEKVH